MKATFGNIISSIRLQKSDLKRIFYYIYEYKIATCKGDLLFHKSGDLKTAIAISFFPTETSLLSMDGLNYI